MIEAPRSPFSQLIPEDCHPKVRALFDYWRSVHPKDGGLPGRQHIDPIDIPHLLPNIWLIDVRRNPYRFRFRLVGTLIVNYAGEDNTGKWFDERLPDFDPGVFIDLVETGKPSWSRGRSKMRPEKNYYELERVRLPLATDAKIVDMILSLTVFFDSGGSEIQRP
ncbi:MAG: PAS domain-containing protein [Alphaproteobacteria bacterium]|nr:PAS domain-containing protein [Alphaproteobacteria bacterium]